MPWHNLTHSKFMTQLSHSSVQRLAQNLLCSACPIMSLGQLVQLMPDCASLAQILLGLLQDMGMHAAYAQKDT